MAKINPNSDAALEVSEQVEFLMAAPIADVAANYGVSIDEAVKMRVEAAVASAPPKLDVSIRPVEPKGNLLGFASLKLNNSFRANVARSSNNIVIVFPVCYRIYINMKGAILQWKTKNTGAM